MTSRLPCEISISAWSKITLRIGNNSLLLPASILYVFKLFLAPRSDDTLHDWNKQNEQERELSGAEDTVNQVAKYLHGVGDSANGLVRVLGGMFGAGVIARIVRGHTFISRHFNPGDKIVLVGFSRGAYTARALGSLIALQGLLNSAAVDLKDKELAGVSIAKSPTAWKIRTAAVAFAWFEYEYGATAAPTATAAPMTRCFRWCRSVCRSLTQRRSSAPRRSDTVQGMPVGRNCHGLRKCTRIREEGRMRVHAS